MKLWTTVLGRTHHILGLNLLKIADWKPLLDFCCDEAPPEQGMGRWVMGH